MLCFLTNFTFSLKQFYLKKKRNFTDTSIVISSFKPSKFKNLKQDTTKVCLAAGSFGTRHCYAEKTQFTERVKKLKFIFFEKIKAV